jgi:hypothetical protein
MHRPSGGLHLGGQVLGGHGDDNMRRKKSGHQAWPDGTLHNRKRSFCQPFAHKFGDLPCEAIPLTETYTFVVAR